MAGKIKGVTIEIGGDVQPLNKALEDVNKKGRDLQSELRQVERLLKLDPGNVELVAQKQKLLTDAVGNTKEKLDTLKEAQKQVEEQFKRGEIGEEQYRALQREVIQTEQDLKKLEKQLDDISNKWKQAGQAIGDFGKKTTDVGKKLSMGVTAPIMGIAAASQVAWKEVDDALDTIVTKTGATGDAMKDFEGSFKNVAKTMPVELQTVGDAIGEVNTQFGLTGPALEAASKQAIQFSQINGQDVSKTAIDARQAIEAFQLETKDLGMVLDAVTKTAQDTGQSTDVLFDRVTKGAPQLKAMNLNFAEGVAIMGKFEQSGVDSSKALSYLAKAQVVFAKEGKTLEQGMEDTIKRMKEAKDETEALTIASEVFGAKGASFMYDAIERGALSFDGFSDAAKNAAGAVESTFEATLDPADQMTVAMNNLKLVGADLGGVIQETLAPMIDKLVGWLQRASEWFDKLSPGMKKTIVVIGGIAAATGPLLVVIGTLVSSIGAIVGALGGIAIGPLLAVVAAVAALVTGVITLWKNNEGFRDGIIGIWEKIKVTVGPVIDMLKETFGKMMESIGPSLEVLKNAFMDLLPILKIIGAVIGTVLAVAFGVIVGVINGVIKAIAPLIQAFGGLISFVTNIVNAVVSLFRGDFAGAWDYLKRAAQGFVDFFSGIVKAIFGFVSGLVTGVIDFFKSLYNALIGHSIIPDLVNGIISWLKKLPGKALEFARSFVSNMTNTIKALPGRALQWGRDIISSLWTGMRNIFGSLSAWFSNNVVGLLNKLNPFTRHSPSLVDQVWAGAKEIEKAYRSIELPELAAMSLQLTPAVAGLGTIQQYDVGSREVRHSGTITIRGVNDAGQLMGAVDIIMDALDDTRVQRKVDEIGHRNRVTTLRPQGVY